MNEIIITNTSLPVTGGCDHLTAIEPFYHADRVADFNVLIYVTEGIIYVTEDDVDYSISAGELLFLKSGVHHYGWFEIPRGTSWYFVHFTLNDENDITEFSPDTSPIPQYNYLRCALTIPKKLSGLEGTYIEQEIVQLIEYFHSDDRFRRWSMNQRLYSLLNKLALERFSEPAQLSLSDRICKYLAAHCCEPFSAEDLQKEFYLSYKYLAAVFKREKHQTMQQYHTALRMNHASKLLRSTLLTVGEIAEKVGYSDMLYFSRCFHKFVGESPSDYRKRPPLY